VSNPSTNDERAQLIVQLLQERHPQTVEALITFVKERVSVPDEEIAASILALQQEGKLQLTKHLPRPAPTLSAYLRTHQAVWYWLTILTAISTTLVIFFVPEDLFPWLYLRYVLGAIFVLWWPGYTLIKTIYPTTVKGRLGSLERIALNLGMSLALVPIVGLLLNYTPWGIRLTPLTLSLLGLTLLFATAGVTREHQTQPTGDG
jgi:hypothetical protein